jgi:hypothetical protein
LASKAMSIARAPRERLRGLARLAQSYTRADGLMVRATIDRHAEVENPNSAFVIFRSAEWALEAITPAGAQAKYPAPWHRHGRACR